VAPADLAIDSPVAPSGAALADIYDSSNPAAFALLATITSGPLSTLAPGARTDLDMRPESFA